MMRQTKKMMLFMTLLTTGLTIQCIQPAPKSMTTNGQDAIAIEMIEGMQGALGINRFAQKQLPLAADQKMTDELMIQVNESKAAFTKLLDEYIGNLGRMYEKKGGFFTRAAYYLSSQNENAGQLTAITPNEYASLMLVLQDAAQVSDWGTTVRVMLPVMSYENNALSQKDLSLNEIIVALRNVPLPAGFSTAAIVGGVAATAAIGGAAYYAYNNPAEVEKLTNYVSGIQKDVTNYFNGSPAAPVKSTLSDEQIAKQNAKTAKMQQHKQNRIDREKAAAEQAADKATTNKVAAADQNAVYRKSYFGSASDIRTAADAENAASTWDKTTKYARERLNDIKEFGNDAAEYANNKLNSARQHMNNAEAQAVAQELADEQAAA